jgi:UDP-N-acetyl-2-amino-2-deoxyglucuronate dehydrogenase
MAKKLKLAIIGCGGMSHGHLDGYINIKKGEPEKFEFAAMCDPVAERAQNFANEAAKTQDKAPRIYADVATMLKSEDLDAADICSRHADHHVNAIDCLNKGVNIMTEKPFGVTIKASKAMIEAGKRNGKITACAENIRRGPGQRAACWMFNESKIIGDPRMFFSQMAGWRDLKPGGWHWRLDLMLGGGGMVMDSGAHFCDTIRFLFGDVDTVYARVEQLEARKAVKDGIIIKDWQEDTWVATINFKSGVIGTWSATWSAPGQGFSHVFYYGSEGSLRDGDVFHGPWPNAELTMKDGTKRPFQEIVDEYMKTLSDDEKNHLFPLGFTNGVFIECYDFLDAIQNGREAEVSGEVGMRAKAICESIFESAYCGQAVKYDDVLSGKVNAYQSQIDTYWGLW